MNYVDWHHRGVDNGHRWLYLVHSLQHRTESKAVQFEDILI